MTFRVDASARSVVIVCQAPGCPWRAIRLDVVAAWATAARHDRDAHDSAAAAAAEYAARRRRGLA